MWRNVGNLNHDDAEKNSQKEVGIASRKSTNVEKTAENKRSYTKLWLKCLCCGNAEK